MNTNQDPQLYISCKDHTVSGERFELYLDPTYDMLVTTPKPDLSVLDSYYESEDYISHTDAKRTLVEKVYQWVKGYAIQNKIKLISKLNKGTGTLLDIGAGTGDFLAVAQKEGWVTKGAEPNASARTLATQKNVEIKSDTKTFEDHSFDVITMWHVLEHVPNLSDQIKELKRLLKPQGYLIIAVPNYKSYDAHYYKSFWAAYDVPRHLWHFSKKAIQLLFSEHNMILEKVIPMKFDSFYVSLLSEKYKKGKINFFNAFYRGLLSNGKAYFSKEYSSHIYVLKNKK